MPLRQPGEWQTLWPEAGRGPTARAPAAALAVTLVAGGVLAGLLTTGCEMGSRDWSEEPTTWRGGRTPSQSLPAPIPSRATRPEAERPATPSPQVREAQQLLRELGRDVGPLDGIAGQRTREEVLRFQRERGLTATGRVSKPLLAELRRAVRRSHKPAPPTAALPKKPSSRPAARSPTTQPFPPRAAPAHRASPAASPAEPPPIDVPPAGIPAVDVPPLPLPPAELPPAEAPVIRTPASTDDRGGPSRVLRQSDPE